MEPKIAFPFRKLRYDKYLTLDVLMYVQHQDAQKFMFAVNREARSFILINFITVRNGFVNDGLIEHEFLDYLPGQFDNYDKLERLYFEAVQRRFENRILTIFVQLRDKKDYFSMFNEVISWIKSQQKQIKLQFKVSFDASCINQLSDFLNANNSVVELDVSSLNSNLDLHSSLYKTLRFLKVNKIEFIDLQCFKRLQILGTKVNPIQLTQVIPYLASKFDQDQFKRMQINLEVTDNQEVSRIYDQNHLDQFKNFLPKRIEFVIGMIKKFGNLKEVLENHFDPDVYSFDRIYYRVKKHRNFNLLEIFSRKTKRFNIEIDSIYDDKKSRMEEYRRPNLNSLTDHLTITGKLRLVELTQLFNIFNNIKSLDIQFCQYVFNVNELFPKIHLCQLQTLTVNESKNLRWFTRSNSLTHITVYTLDEIADIESIIEPSKLLFLFVGQVDKRQKDIELFVAKLKGITALSLSFDSISCDRNQLGSIYRSCSRSLKTFQIYGQVAGGDQVKFVERLLLTMRPNLIQRQYPLTLDLSLYLSIQTVLRIKRILEGDNTLNKKLQLSFSNVKEGEKEDYLEATTYIQEEKHPILSQFISIMSKIH